MDLIKIGKYIAGKRKALGLTQKQLAEQLGMSDKSVSKWERGICLPDVSLYRELCDILGISINEFLAGEDIAPEELPQKSEDTILEVSKDSENKQNLLRRKFSAATILAILALAAFIVTLILTVFKPTNYIEPVDMDSAEQKTASILSGVDGAFLYKYYTNGDYQRVQIKMTHIDVEGNGSQETVLEMDFSEEFPMKDGIIAIVPDMDKESFRIILADEWSKFYTDVDISGQGDIVGRYHATLASKEKLNYEVTLLYFNIQSEDAEWSYSFEVSFE